MELRPYQFDALQAVAADLRKSKPAAPLVVLPTGSGKSLLVGELLLYCIGYGMRCVMLTHVKELVEQNLQIATQMGIPSSEVGVCCAGLGSRDVTKPLTMGTIQTYVNVESDGLFVSESDLAPDMVIVDEVHLVSKKGVGRYRTALARARALNPDCAFVGLTATPFRLDGGYLHVGEGSIFDRIAYTISFSKLVELGFLSPLKTFGLTSHQMDMSQAKIVAGQFRKSDEEKAAFKVTVKAMGHAAAIMASDNRKKGLFFFPSIECSKTGAATLRNLGLHVVEVYGHTPKAERADLIAEFKNSADPIILCNVDVLTTGFNVADIDTVAVVRATMSTSLWVQMLGRGSRIAPGKQNCMVLDFGGNAMRHGPIDDVTVQKQRGDVEKPNGRLCPKCEGISSLRAKVCEMCGYEWPIPKPAAPQHSDKPSNASVMASERRREINVIKTKYASYESKAGNLCLVATLFESELSTYQNYVVWAGQPMYRFWRHRGIPGSPTGVIEVDLPIIRAHARPVVSATLEQRGKYWNVISERLGSRPTTESPR